MSTAFLLWLIHCRNNFEARIQLFELELLVRPWGQARSFTVVTAYARRRQSTTCLQLRAPHTSSTYNVPAALQRRLMLTAARCFADTCQKMAEAIADSWTRRRSNLRGHKSLLPHVYGSAEVWCCARCLCRVYSKSIRKFES